jgi:hypothetical protein
MARSAGVAPDAPRDVIEAAGQAMPTFKKVQKAIRKAILELDNS